MRPSQKFWQLPMEKNRERMIEKPDWAGKETASKKMYQKQHSKDIPKTFKNQSNQKKHFNNNILAAEKTSTGFF